jgi:hypothetical protein
MRRLVSTLAFLGLMLGALLLPATAASADSSVEYIIILSTAIEYGL